MLWSCKKFRAKLPAETKMTNSFQEKISLNYKVIKYQHLSFLYIHTMYLDHDEVMIYETKIFEK